ncbi:MAG: hypothetical protein IT303_17450 [Dehalococcoidia bacterium]|nr:hypothetical protein [Dehalococcoidia bacterium]
MKSLLVVAFVVAAGLLVVPALFFRSERARNILKTLRNVAWTLIALIFIAAIIQVVRDGGI